MLHLSRKPGESITIGHGVHAVTVRVNEVRGNRVQLSIQAPRDVDVRRSELPEKPRHDMLKDPTP